MQQNGVRLQNAMHILIVNLKRIILYVHIQQSEHKFGHRRVSSLGQEPILLANIWNQHISYVGSTHLDELLMSKSGQNDARLH